ncbi:MAG: family hydrolase [Sedimentibacter sp.]|jgi:phosphoglycolate phosphatase|nr:family hydrolase [Sedimentibacter sp.]
MTKEGIIFDLDGTLWDSSESVTNSWNEAIATYDNINYKMTVQAMKGFMGKTIEEIAALFFEEFSLNERKQIMDKCIVFEQDYIEKNGGILFPGVEETLELLSSQYRLFIVSNCQEGYIEAFLNYHKLSKYFDDYENPGRTGKTKGENIKLVMERNRLDKAVYIGDTEGDLSSARFAGIPFIHARYGFGQIKEIVPYVDNVPQIPERVKEIIK